jgi:hypothetical protein
VHLGCFYSGSAPPEQRGRGPSRPFGLSAKTGEPVSGGRVEGGSQQRSSGGERRRRLGPKVLINEGVDVVELRTRAILLEVVVRPEVLRRRRSTATRVKEKGGVVNLLFWRRSSAARAPTRC